MNPLTSKKLMQDAFKSIAETVLVNDVEQLAYITNAHLGDASRRHIHALQPFQQGDYVEFGEGVYLVVEDVINIRGAKYKATIEYCNYMIKTPDTEERTIIGFDSMGRPIYEYITHPGRDIHAILDMDRVTITGSQIRINTSVMMMLVPDSDENREEIQVNGEIDIYGTVMRVVNINRLRKGLMEITMERKP